MMEIPVNETKCPKCQAILKIHAPAIVAHHDANMTQVSLVPSWSMDERVCRGCGSIVAPRIKHIEVELVAYEPPKEQSRIVQASALPPVDLMRKLHAVGGK